MSALVQDLIAAQASDHGDTAAVECGSERATFSQLEARSNQLARLLRDHGCRRGDRVGVLAPVGPASLIGMLAALKADAIYVPLDPRHRPALLSQILVACEPACVLTTGPTATVVDELNKSGALNATKTIGSLERTPIVGQAFVTSFCMNDAGTLSDRAVAFRNRASSPACILFAGRSAEVGPGVVTTHADLVRAATWAIHRFDVRPTDRWGITRPLGVDRLAFETVTALAAGATVCALPSDGTSRPRLLADSLRRASVTHWFAEPRDLAHLADADLVSPGDFPALRHVVTWSAADPAVVRHWTTRVGRTEFASLYGVAEGTMASACLVWSRDTVGASEAVSIGVARPGQEVFVLNDALDPVPPGVVGEVWIGGIGVSPGYWRDQEASSRVFRRMTDRLSGVERMCRTGDYGFRNDQGQVLLAGEGRGPLRTTPASERPASMGR